jgi:FtsP/CotA-like multicopper oxidase with cupredoxin domain
MSLVFVVLVLLSLSAHCPLSLGAALVEPLVLSSSSTEWSLSLAVRAARFDDGAVSFWSRQFCTTSDGEEGGGTEGARRCAFPGPTLHVKPGDLLSLTLHNELGETDAATAAAAHTSSSQQHDHPRADPNVTNLHTHGLHVSVQVDSVFVSIAPGHAHTYALRIPPDHAPGLAWMHAHRHETTALQVMGGLHGAIVVEPASAANVPSSYPKLPSSLLVLSHVQLAQLRDAYGEVSQSCAPGAGCTEAQGCAAGTTGSTFDMFRSSSYPELAREAGDAMQLPSLDERSNGNGGAEEIELQTFERYNHYVVNGQLQPTITLTAGRWHVLKLLHAGGAHALDIEFPLTDDGCTVEVLAIDGVFLDAVLPVSRKLRALPASRWEVQLMCAAGRARLRDVWASWADGVQLLFTLAVTDELDDKPHPSSSAAAAAPSSSPRVTDAELAAIERPSYLSDLRGALHDDDDDDKGEGAAAAAAEREPVHRYSVSFAHLAPSATHQPRNEHDDKSTCDGPGDSNSDHTGSSSCPPLMMGGGEDCGAVWRGEVPASASTLVRRHNDSALVSNPCRFRSFSANGHTDGGRGTGSDHFDARWGYGFVAPLGGLAEIKVYGMGVRVPENASSSSEEQHHHHHGGEVHPFHVHAHHMQVVSFEPTNRASSDVIPGTEQSGAAAAVITADDDLFRIGQWRDVVPSLDGEMVLRFRVDSAPDDAGRGGGATVLHCHTLAHEDRGMMGAFYACDDQVEGACPESVTTRTRNTVVVRSAASAMISQLAWAVFVGSALVGLLLLL